MMDDGNFGRQMIRDLFKGVGYCVLMGLAFALLAMVVEALGVRVLP